MSLNKEIKPKEEIIIIIIELSILLEIALLSVTVLKHSLTNIMTIFARLQKHT